MNGETFWLTFLKCYLITISIETPILFVGLSRKHSWQKKLLFGIWLTACTYPVVWIVLPRWLDYENHYNLYLAVAETFAPLAECALFTLAVGWQETRWRDWIAIIVANLASFLSVYVPGVAAFFVF